MATEHLGVAVIGCGGIAAAHLRALTAVRGGRLVAAVDAIGERAEAVTQCYGGRAYTSWGDALLDPSVDACIVCLPHHLHEAATIAACQAGKHVLVEKPMAIGLAQSKAMVQAAESAGVALMVGQVLRFRNLNRKARELLRGGRIGQVVSLLRRRHSYSRAYPQAPWSEDPAKAGGWLLYGFGAPDMIAEATKDARRAAMQFAQDSGSKVGKIRSAQQGYFSIEDLDSYTPDIKKVRVVTTVEYLLLD
jgi:predicted dehydrogenase